MIFESHRSKTAWEEKRREKVIVREGRRTERERGNIIAKSPEIHDFNISYLSPMCVEQNSKSFILWF